VVSATLFNEKRPAPGGIRTINGGLPVDGLEEFSPQNLDRYRVHPGAACRLVEHDPDDKGLFPGNKEAGLAILPAIHARLIELQELLYAEGKRKLLVVLQAMDTAGKDGTIRQVFGCLNPQGVRVASFKAPTAAELAHDYLWRVHHHTPGSGEIVVFNRSHYEDVLVVRVRALVPQERWEKRYAQLADFERMLVEEGTTVLKFFLHIDRDEQKRRLEARLADPAKHWKFDAGDLAERKLWDDYMKAYEAAMGRTSTKTAPWYVVPANRKWYRNLVIGKILIHALEGLGMQYPPPPEGLEKITIE
jgi:PPK2 family polyphosphate:nucleotide phosphotransferase